MVVFVVVRDGATRVFKRAHVDARSSIFCFSALITATAGKLLGPIHGMNLQVLVQGFRDMYSGFMFTDKGLWIRA